MSATEITKRGRPTAYCDEYAEQGGRLALLGLTDAEMAKFFQVSERTVNTWKKMHPEFLQALKDNKVSADAKVALSLYKLAIGGHTVTEVRKTKNPDGTESITEATTQVPPNTTAAIFWLKNRQPGQWRDKIEVQADVRTDPFPPEAELDAIAARNHAKAAERQKMLEGRMERLGITIAPERDED